MPRVAAKTSRSTPAQPNSRRPLLILGGLGLAAAALAAGLALYGATDALPGGAEYAIRQDLEGARLVLAGTPESRAALHLEFAAGRLADVDRASREQRAAPIMHELLAALDREVLAALDEGSASVEAHRLVLSGAGRIAADEDRTGRRLIAAGRDTGDDARAATGNALRQLAEQHQRDLKAYAQSAAGT